MAVADPIQIRAVGGVQTFDTGSRYCLEREKISSSVPGFPTIDPLDLLGRTVLFLTMAVLTSRVSILWSFALMRVARLLSAALLFNGMGNVAKRFQPAT